MFLAILSRDIAVFEGFWHLPGFGNVLCIEDVITITQICQDLMWNEGLLLMLQTSVVIEIFLHASV